MPQGTLARMCKLRSELWMEQRTIQFCRSGAYLHSGKVNKIPQGAELPQAQHRHHIGILLHGQPHKACTEPRH